MAPAGREGFLQPLVRRALPSRAVDFEPSRDTLSLGTDVPTTPKGKRSQFARQAVTLAKAFGWDLVVIHADADDSVRRQGKPPKAFGDKRKELLDGAASIVQAPPLVVACPIRMTEAWALGDLATVQSEAGGSLRGTPPTRLASPESLHGSPSDPDSDYPKHVLARLLGKPATADVQARLAENLDLTKARAACPHSLDRFLLDLDAAT